ncbi:hypothetical protein LJK88_46460 [Paenibacillus sp. P26]|nr:hypothetical protein LJK88_46460 [Paenibacillus sp. P26]UUZ91967.1 hypothetical protein LJK87_41855 [Paenibacillus sp. P25]
MEKDTPSYFDGRMTEERAKELAELVKAPKKHNEAKQIFDSNMETDGPSYFDGRMTEKRAKELAELVRASKHDEV